MKTSAAIQCIVLLACMFNINYHFLCFPGPPRCRCVKTSKSVRIALITQLKVDEPHPHCDRREVIVTLKDGHERCLDPESKFTRYLESEEKYDRQLRNSHSISHSARIITIHFACLALLQHVWIKKKEQHSSRL
uniref:Chemokine interleukin-8-like domain-containing protein n=1 Tax=Oreochromis niloticus TaxID=8128 RepID=A0A669CUU0_ORENI